MNDFNISHIFLKFQLDIIEGIHEKGFLFNDIKPHNFAIGADPEHWGKIYIFDFGLTKSYLENGKHKSSKPGIVFACIIYMYS